MGPCLGDTAPRGWWHAHRSPSVPTGPRACVQSPRQRDTGKSELKQLRSHHLCLSRVSHKYESLLLRIPLTRLTAVCAWKAAVRSRAINWIVRARLGKRLQCFYNYLPLPDPQRRALSLCLCGKTGSRLSLFHDYTVVVRVIVTTPRDKGIYPPHLPCCRLSGPPLFSRVG